MSERRAASVKIGRPGEVPAPHKPVAEMTDDEKTAYRNTVAEHLETAKSQGNKLMCEIDVDWEDYKGVIQMKRPSIDEERQIGIRVAKYLQGAVGVDLKTENLACFLAAFDVCVDWATAPKWFDPRSMPGGDYSLLEYVFGRWNSWLSTFRRFVPPAPARDGEAAEDESGVVGDRPVESPAHGSAV
jgi:hypothetical protein